METQNASEPCEEIKQGSQEEGERVPTSSKETSKPPVLPEESAHSSIIDGDPPATSLPGDDNGSPPQEEVKTSDVYQLKNEVPRRFDHPGV